MADGSGLLVLAQELGGLVQVSEGKSHPDGGACQPPTALPVVSQIQLLLALNLITVASATEMSFTSERPRSIKRPALLTSQGFVSRQYVRLRAARPSGGN